MATVYAGLVPSSGKGGALHYRSPQSHCVNPTITTFAEGVSSALGPLQTDIWTHSWSSEIRIIKGPRCLCFWVVLFRI